MIRREACRGCRDDYYNTFSGDRCWSAKTGKMMTRYEIGTWTRPTEPGAFMKVRKPSCYGRSGVAYYNALPDFVSLDQVIGAARKRRTRPTTEGSGNP